MNKFLQKYKWHLVGVSCYALLFLLLRHKQDRYYLSDDVNRFKSVYLTPILIYTFFASCILPVFIFLIKTKSIVKGLDTLYFAPFILGPIFLLSQDLVLDGTLFINRQFKNESIQRNFIVGYRDGEGEVSGAIYVYDISNGKYISDRDFFDRLYKSRSNNSDTIALHFNKGLFGVVYFQCLNQK